MGLCRFVKGGFSVAVEGEPKPVDVSEEVRQALADSVAEGRLVITQEPTVAPSLTDPTGTVLAGLRHNSVEAGTGQSGAGQCGQGAQREGPVLFPGVGEESFVVVEVGEEAEVAAKCFR